MAPPPQLPNSSDEIDLDCWPWSEDWTADCSNIELFSDVCGTSDYCKAVSSIGSIELDNNVIKNDSCNDKLNIFQNSSKINDLFSSLPLAKCELLESSDIKSECDFVLSKKLSVSDKESPSKFTLDNPDENFSRDIINSLQSNILEHKCLLKNEGSFSPLQFQSCATLPCPDSLKKNKFQLCDDKCSKNKCEISNYKRIVKIPDINYKLKNKTESGYNSSIKKLCLDQITVQPIKGRYFMRSSYGSSYDLLQSKTPQLLLDQNKNVQDNLTLSTTRLKCSLQSLSNTNFKCDSNCSIRNNEQLNYSTSKLTSGDFNTGKIRFPKLDSHWISLRGNIMCRWNDCDSHFTASAKLIEHLQV